MLRNEEIQKLRHLRFPDVLIIGAGINGASVFSNLVKTDVTVVIVDKTDFGAGATNASSRMAHGGLKYLETGELSLIRRSIRSRNWLLKNYPHYIRPLFLTVPVKSHFGGVLSAAIRFFKPSNEIMDRGEILIRFGLYIYDLLSRPTQCLPKSSRRNRCEMREIHKGIAEEFRASLCYFEGAISNPERIALELVDDGLQVRGDCVAINHCEFVGETSNGIVLQDSIGGEDFLIKPRVVVNATGAWVHHVNGRFASAGPRLVNGVKGSHLVLSSIELVSSMNGSGFVWSNADGRLSIMYPLGSKVLLGSTEISVSYPEGVACEEDEQRYLLEALHALFPDLAITSKEVIFKYSGVRPLLASGEGIPRNATRDHHIEHTQPGNGREFHKLDLVGGKWTTFADFGETVAKHVCRILGKGENIARKAKFKAGEEGQKFPSKDQDCKRLGNLTEKYGPVRGARIAEFCRQAADKELRNLLGYSMNEIAWFIHQEAAVTLEDIFFRRTNIVFCERLTLAMISEVSDVLAKELRLTPQEMEKEKSRFIEKLKQNHGVILVDAVDEGENLT